MNRKLLKILFILLLWILFNKSTLASWSKYPGNPVLTLSSNGWDSKNVDAPSILFENNKYKMWFEGDDGIKTSIGLAESIDGKVWIKYSNNPVLIASNEAQLIENFVGEPSVLKNDIYRMWYNSFDTSNPKYKIRYATSTDGINWQKYPGYVLESTSSWESRGVTNPSVIFHDNKYKMWYAAAGGEFDWSIGYAESLDGIKWTKYENNPLKLPTLGNNSGPSVIEINGSLHMFYHTNSSSQGGTTSQIFHLSSTDGIHWSCVDSCSILNAEGIGFDSKHVYNPVVYKDHSLLYLWYGGSNDINIQIGLATKKLEEEKSPIVIIPGLMGSWNKEAILYNKEVDPDSWQLTPIAKEYEGLLTTLDNLGYQKDKDYFVFAYDWRKRLEDLAGDLKGYLERKVLPFNPSSKVNLVGHSLGGLVGRIYAQKYGTDNIGKIITVGSPHKGTALAYKAVEGGELERDDPLMWLGQKIILQIYNNGLKTDRQVINSQLPIVKDLLPTTNYLIDSNNKEIPLQLMQIRNEVLPKYNSSFENIFPYLKTIIGEKGDTLSGYKVGQRTILDQLLDNYPDGRPIGHILQPGDFTITSTSAAIGNDPAVLNLDHGEIVYKPEGIKKILTSLNIDYDESQITAGSKTNIYPSLLFIMLSPAEMEVSLEDESYLEQNGLIFIDSAQTGLYTLKVKGKNKGRYTVLIGQIGVNNDQWNKIEGEITNEIPSSQIDIYSFNFDSLSPQPFYTAIENIDLLFNELIIYLTDINKNLKNDNIDNALKYLFKAKTNYQNEEYSQLRLNLLFVHKHIFNARHNLDEFSKAKLLYAAEKLEALFGAALKGKKVDISNKTLEKELDKYTKIISKVPDFLLDRKKEGLNVERNISVLLKIQERLNLIGEYIKNNQLSFAEILLNTVEKLTQEVRALSQ